MTINDAIKITELLKAQINACEQLKTDGLAFSRNDYKRALVVVLGAAKAYRKANDERNEMWGQ